jgi:DnaB-like helicase N terminal domain
LQPVLAAQFEAIDGAKLARHAPFLKRFAIKSTTGTGEHMLATVEMLPRDGLNGRAYNARNEPEPFRKPPHNLDAEQALLGAILIKNEAYVCVSDFLFPYHFYDPLHGAVYDAIGKTIAAGQRADGITLKSYLENAENIDGRTTATQYVGQLALNATTSESAEAYGRVIHDCSIRRQVILIAEDMQRAAYDTPVDFAPDQQIAEHHWLR